MMRSTLSLLALLGVSMLGAPSCSCDPPQEDPPVADAVGGVRVDVAAGAATLVLTDLDEPLRALQVDVAVDGGTATAFLGLADHDLVEAGLGADDGGPADRFTAVVGDTRRLPINDGPVGRIALSDDGATVTLSKAFGIDQQGQKRPLTVVAP